MVPATPWWPRHVDPEKSGVPGRVVTYDVGARKIAGDLEPCRDGTGGTLVEWRSGLIVGRFDTAHHGGPEVVFFLLDVVSQRMLDTRRVSGTSAGRLLRLPDGHLLGYHNGGIYRLDPEAWSFEPLFRLGPAPRDWRVVTGEIYAFLDTRLVRLTGVT